MTEQEIDERLQVVAFQSQAQATLTYLQTYAIDSASEYADAARQDAEWKDELDRLDEACKEITAPLKKVIKLVEDRARPKATFLTSARDLLRRAMGTFVQKQQAAQAQALEEASRLAQQGSVAEATQAMVQVKALAAPEVAGVSTTDKWEVAAIDVAKLPPEYLVPDMVKINAIVRASKTANPIPGVTATCRKVVTNRGAA